MLVLNLTPASTKEVEFLKCFNCLVMGLCFVEYSQVLKVILVILQWIGCDIESYEPVLYIGYIDMVYYKQNVQSSHNICPCVDFTFIILILTILGKFKARAYIYILYTVWN